MVFGEKLLVHWQKLRLSSRLGCIQFESVVRKIAKFERWKNQTLKIELEIFCRIKTFQFRLFLFNFIGDFRTSDFVTLRFLRFPTSCKPKT